MKTASVNKQELMQHAQQDMQKWISDSDLTDRQKLALTCRILFDHGHDAGLAGQITCRSENKETFITQRFGLGFDEITASNLLGSKSRSRTHQSRRNGKPSQPFSHLDL